QYKTHDLNDLSPSRLNFHEDPGLSSKVRPRRPPRSTPFPYTTLFRSSWPTRKSTPPTPSRSATPIRPSPAAFTRTRPTTRSSPTDRKSTRLNSSHVKISYAVFCLKKKTKKTRACRPRCAHIYHLRGAS